jgi:hypothetical protein
LKGILLKMAERKKARTVPPIVMPRAIPTNEVLHFLARSSDRASTIKGYEGAALLWVLLGFLQN